MILEIRDERPEVAPRLVARHENVSDDLTSAEVLTRFGIPSHLRVTLIENGERRVVQQGRR